MKIQRTVCVCLLTIGLSGAGHAGVIVVDKQNPKASDTNPGSVELPLKTISAAAKAARAGDTVLVKPGLYREAVEIVNSGKEGNPIVFRSEAPQGAVISGADILTGWQPAGPGIWSVATPSIAAAGHRRVEGQWIYVNGCPLQRAEERSRLLPGMFYLDQTNKVAYVAPEDGRAPDPLAVEFACREGLFHAKNMAQHKVEPPDYVHISGFTLIHDASWVRGWGALSFTGQGWLIESNHVLWCTSAGILGIQATGTTIRNNLVEWAGHLGLGVSGSANLLVEGNRVFHSNWRRVSPAWECGGLKYCSCLDSVIRSNVFAYSYGPGLWFDGANTGNLMEGNVCHDNMGIGIFTEIDWEQIIRNNICFNNQEGGVVVAESCGVLVRQNVLFNNGAGVFMRGDFRRRGCQGEREPKANRMAWRGVSPLRLEQWTAQYIVYWNAPKAIMSNNSAIWENLIFDNDCNYYEYRDYANPSAIDPFVNNFSDFNLYHAERPADYFRHELGQYGSFEEWQRVSGRDANSVILNPRTEGAKLPPWAKAGEKYWQREYLAPREMKALNLKLFGSSQAAEAMARIRHSPFMRELKFSDGEIKAYLMDVDGQRTLALWSKQIFGRRYIRLDVGTQKITMENAYLQKEDRALRNQALDLAVTWLPMYLRGVGEEIREVQSGILRVEAFNSPGEKIPAEAVFLNEGAASQPLQLSFLSSPGFKPVPDNVATTISAGASATIACALVPDGSMLKGAGILRMEGIAGSEKFDRVASFLVGEGSGNIPFVPAGQIRVDGKHDDWGKIVSQQPPLGVINTAGQFNNGDAALWRGPQDLGATIYAGWNTGALYVAVAVTDESVVPALPGTAPWTADAVEVFVDGRSPEMQWQPEPTEGCYQIGVGPAKGDLPAPASVFRKTVQGLQTATSLTASGYLVELMIPLTFENFPADAWKKGRAIKLAVLVNDKDNPAARDREVAFYWGTTAGDYFMDTSAWPTLLLDLPETIP